MPQPSGGATLGQLNPISLETNRLRIKSRNRVVAQPSRHRIETPESQQLETSAVWQNSCLSEYEVSASNSPPPNAKNFEGARRLKT